MDGADGRRDGQGGGARAGLIVFLVCVFSLNQFAISIFLPAMPEMARALGAGGAATKATLTVYLIVYAIAALIHGPLSDRYGRRPVLLAGLGVYTAASFACALAPNIEVLLAARMLQAFGAASGVVLARAIARDVMDGPALMRTNAYLATGQGVAPGLAPLLGGLLAGSGGVIYALVNTTTVWNAGFKNGMFAFTAAVLGGIGNLTGAVLGAILLGLIASYSSLYVGDRWVDVVIFSILVMVLVFRPTGLLGESSVARA